MLSIVSHTPYLIKQLSTVIINILGSQQNWQHTEREEGMKERLRLFHKKIKRLLDMHKQTNTKSSCTKQKQLIIQWRAQHDY